MASLNLRPQIHDDPTFKETEVALSWGENKLSDNEPIGIKDPSFQRYRNNFRNYHVLEGNRQQQAEDCCLPRPLENNFYGRINSGHNTIRRIRRPCNSQTIPWNDYKRCDDNGQHPLTDATIEALDGKDKDLHRSSRYSQVFPDHSSHVVPVPGHVPPQHYHHRQINKMLKRNHDYQIWMPPFKHRGPPTAIYESPVTATSIPNEKYSCTFIKKLKNLRSSDDLEPVDTIGITQKRCKKIKYPFGSGKVGQSVRFILPEEKKPPAPSTENLPQAPYLGPDTWQTLDRETRHAVCRHRLENYKKLQASHMKPSEGDALYVSQQGVSKPKNNKELPIPDLHEDLEEDDDEEEKPEKDIVEEDKSLGCQCRTDPFTFKLIHKCGKFVSPWKSNIDPNYFCSKSESSKRFHSQFPDKVPDLRDNYTYGKRILFDGFNSSTFR